MSKIYVITSGEYSDYSIINVLSTKELAEEFKEYYNSNLVDRYNKCDIETYELDKWIPQFREGLRQYSVYIQSDGTVRDCGETRSIDTWRPSVVLQHMIKSHYMKKLPVWPIVAKNLDEYCTPGLYILCWAKDEEHAIKIANEKRTALLAQDLIPDTVVDLDEFQKSHGYWNTVEDFWKWKNEQA